MFVPRHAGPLLYLIDAFFCHKSKAASAACRFVISGGSGSSLPPKHLHVLFK